MLFLVWIGALCLYCFLYLAWESVQNHLQGPYSLLEAFNKMLVMPDHLAFVILRGLILATLLYILADSLLSTRHRVARKAVPLRKLQHRG